MRVLVQLLSFSSNNFAIKAKRKTLTAGDVFNALGDIEFEQLVPDLKQFLEGKCRILVCIANHNSKTSAYKEEQKGKKEAAASDKKRRQAEAMTQESEPVPMDQVG